MMLNVSQILAKANQEKMRPKILYWKHHQVLTEMAKTKEIISDHIPGPVHARKTCV